MQNPKINLISDNIYYTNYIINTEWTYSKTLHIDMITSQHQSH